MNYQTAHQHAEMPTRQKIADWWLSKEGKARARAIEREYGTKRMTGRLFKRRAQCWACGHTPGLGTSYSSKFIGLERCHIKPWASLGSNDPSNLVIMCKTCHLDSPDSDDERLFWEWFASVVDGKKDRLMRAARHKVTAGQTDVRGLIEAYITCAMDDEPVLVGSALSYGYSEMLLRRIARKFGKRGKRMTGAEERSMARSLLWAHRLLEGMLQWRNLIFNMQGLRHRDYMRLRGEAFNELRRLNEKVGDKRHKAWANWVAEALGEDPLDEYNANRDLSNEFLWRCSSHIRKQLQELAPGYDDRGVYPSDYEEDHPISLACGMEVDFYDGWGLLDWGPCLKQRNDLVRFALARLIARDDEQFHSGTVRNGRWSAPSLGFDSTPKLDDRDIEFLIQIGAAKR